MKEEEMKRILELEDEEIVEENIGGEDDGIIEEMVETKPKMIRASSGILHPEPDFESKPDEGRLLTREEVKKIVDFVV